MQRYSPQRYTGFPAREFWRQQQERALRNNWYSTTPNWRLNSHPTVLWHWPNGTTRRKCRSLDGEWPKRRRENQRANQKNQSHRLHYNQDVERAHPHASHRPSRQRGRTMSTSRTEYHYKVIIHGKQLVTSETNRTCQQGSPNKESMDMKRTLSRSRRTIFRPIEYVAHFHLIWKLGIQRGRDPCSILS